MTTSYPVSSTHDLRGATRLRERLIVMLNGRIVEEGETAALFAGPRNDYTRALSTAASKLKQAEAPDVRS